MATEVTLPELGESVTEGTVTSWLKAVGDEVAVDEPLLEVSTDKVDTEIPSPAAGTLLEIKAQEDETVEVGAVLAVIGAGGEPAAAPSESASASEARASDSGDGHGAGEASPDGAASDEGDGNSDDASDGDTASGEATVGEPEGPAAESSTQESSPASAPGDPQTDEGATDAAPSEQAPAARADSQPADDSDPGAGQSTEVTLPALGESVTEGTVTSWLKSVGDEVTVDEPLLEVSTDKVDTEIPSPVAGRLQEIRVAEDETVEVGAVLAVIGSDAPKVSAAPSEAPTEPAAGDETATSTEQAGGVQAESSEADAPAATSSDVETGEAEVAAEAPPSAAEPSERSDDSDDKQAEPQPQADALPTPDAARPTGQAAATASSPSTSAGSAESGDDGDTRVYVTPLVRKLAAQHDVKLDRLTGSGVGGRIRKQDVLQAAEEASRAAAGQAEQPQTVSAPVASPLRGKTEKLSRLRRVIAARMLESLQTSAQLTTVVEVDVTSISRLRDRVKSTFEQREGVKLSFLPFFAKAAVDALKTYPQVNASINTDAGEVTYHEAEHLGVAVDTERGLLVPVIKDAGDLSIAGLARKIADLAARTRENKVTPDELSGGTFTLTNTGSRGALFDTPIINQPQVAILGTGTVVKRPVVIDDPNLGETIAIRQMVYLALTYDHRLVDGADAARFLTTIKQRLEDANFESELGI
jgi:pyruvate dehydrogenase E2 component (dihydrolipoamide acetyltransferase)